MILNNRFLYNKNTTNRINKIYWMLFFFLITSIILIINNTYPISLSIGIPSVLQIPIYFWVLCIIFLLVWVKLFLKCKDSRLLIIGVISYYFILFSSNLMFVSPYEQTDRISSYISTLDNTPFIGEEQIRFDDYYQWPVFFILTKILLEIGNLSINQILQTGFFSINLIMPIILFYMFTINKDNSENNYLLSTIIYILIAYTFIVNQYAPQALALLLLFLAYAIYFSLVKSYGIKRAVKLAMLIFIFSTLVFTHAFLFLFFLVPLVIDYLYRFITRKEHNSISVKTIFLLFVIYFTGLFYRYVSVGSNVARLFELLGSAEGETWKTLFTIFNTGSGIIVTPSYYPILEQSHLLLSNSLKIVFFTLFFIIIFIYVKYPDVRKKITSLDFSIVLTSFWLFIFGLFSIFLGQRGIQVAVSSLVKVFMSRMDRYSFIIRCAIILIIIVTPVLLVTTSLTNNARSGESLTEDQEMNAAGYFVDEMIPKNSNILFAESIYPVNRPPSRFNEYIYLQEIHERYYILDYVLVTPKLTLQAKYFGYEYMVIGDDRNCVYSNGVSELQYMF